MDDRYGRRDRLDVHNYFHTDPVITSALAGIATTLDLIMKGQIAMQAAMEKVAREVAETKTVTESAIALIEGIAQQIRDNVANAAKLNQLADELDANANALAAKVTENTPAPPPAPPAE